MGMPHAVGVPPPGGGFLPQHHFLRLSRRLCLRGPSFPLVVRRPVRSVLGLGRSRGKRGSGRGGGEGCRCSLWGAFGRGVPVQVGARVRRVPERVGLLHDAACLAVKRGAVAAITHRLVVHALAGGQPPALGSSL